MSDSPTLIVLSVLNLILTFLTPIVLSCSILIKQIRKSSCLGSSIETRGEASPLKENKPSFREVIKTDEPASKTPNIKIKK